MQKSPQLEDGYIRIANELFDAVLRAKLKYTTQSVLFAVIRKTYGYGKKEDDISASQLGEMCGMSRSHVTNALNELAALQVIHKRPGRYGSIVGVNKDYSKWNVWGKAVRKTSTKSVQVYESGTSTNSVQVYENSTSTSTNSVQVDSTNLVHTKDNLPKDNRQKDLSGKPSAASFTADAKAALEYLNTKTGASFRPVDSNLELVKARLKEGYSLDEVKAVIDLKAAEWGGDPKMQKYLRPKTIFSATNFNQYIGQIPQGGGDWWTRLGFRSAFEAENAGYSKHSAKVHA